VAGEGEQIKTRELPVAGAKPAEQAVPTPEPEVSPSMFIDVGTEVMAAPHLPVPPRPPPAEAPMVPLEPLPSPRPTGAASSRSPGSLPPRPPTRPPPFPSSPSRPSITSSQASPRATEAPSQSSEGLATLAHELRARAQRLAPRDATAAARTYVELGLYEERGLGEPKAARRSYEAACELAAPFAPALERRRRLLDRRAEAPQALALIDDELRASADARRADLLAERARLCEGLGRHADAQAAYAAALRDAPAHGAALRGLEAVLRREAGRSEAGAAELGAHLEKMAEAYGPGEGGAGGDRTLAAWLLVERAWLLARSGERAEEASASLWRAVALEPLPGPVRDALTRHLVRRGDLPGLVTTWTAEANAEADDGRAARLLYLAARLQVDRLRQHGEAAALLGRAGARAAITTPVARRVALELVRLLEAGGKLEPAAASRLQLVAMLADAPSVAHEHTRLCDLYEALGDGERSAAHARRALAEVPGDGALRERLDRSLARLGRHDERVALWAARGHAEGPPGPRVAALLRAAEIAERRMHRRDEALTHLRAAWLLAPDDPEVFDALSALLTPPERDPEADARGVRARLDLYRQAAAAATDPARRIGLLEKVVSIWEDELCQPARAVETLEAVLALDPSRRSAVLALQRNARRAGDWRALVAALRREAELSQDPALRRGLLVRAARLTAEAQDDIDGAFALLEQASRVEGDRPDVLRARADLSLRAGRHDEARKALVALVPSAEGADEAFALWVEVARLDEQRRKRPDEAIEAYRQASLVRPEHLLPRQELARLLYELGRPDTLAAALSDLAAAAKVPAEAAALLVRAAEVHEFLLGDDENALALLERADALEGPAEGSDPSIIEGLERLLVRRAARAELVRIYGRWLDRAPPPARALRLRLGLAAALLEHNPQKAAEALGPALAAAPRHLPSLRVLALAYRLADAAHALADALRAEAEATTSSLARVGAFWEVAKLEERLGLGPTPATLGRLYDEAPDDSAVAEALFRALPAPAPNAPPPDPGLLHRALDSIRRRVERAPTPFARAVLLLEEGLLLEQSGSSPEARRMALASYRKALEAWPESLVAARGVERLAEQAGDRPALALAHHALAGLADDPRARAAHLVRAAAIAAEAYDAPSRKRARDLYETALRTDPDCAPAASALTNLLSNDLPRLVERFGDALDEARSPAQVALLGKALGRAVLDLQEASPGPEAPPPDPSLGVTALQRVLQDSPRDVEALLLCARLLSGARLYPAARDLLARAAEAAPDIATRVAAHFELAALFHGPLADLAEAQSALRALLAVDPTNRRALEWLFTIGVERGDRPLAVQALERLVGATPDVPSKVEVLLRLAETYREGNDAASAVRALGEAVVLAPTDDQPWKALGQIFRVESPDGAAAYAGAIEHVLRVADARQVPVEPRWLTTLGLLEATVLQRGPEAIEHLRRAVALPGALPDTRVALGRGLEVTGRNGEAVMALRDVLTTDRGTFARIRYLGTALASLEAALAKDGRAEERAAVEEVRMSLGQTAPERAERVRARRALPMMPTAPAFSNDDLTRVLVGDALSPLVEVAIAIAPLSAKLLRFDLTSLGLGARDRLGPRDPHPLRQLADRIARAYGIDAYDLYLAPSWSGPLRLVPGEQPTLVAPAPLAEAPEMEQAFALAHIFARAMLGMVWLDNLQLDALDGLFLAALRTVQPSFGAGDVSPLRERATGTFGPVLPRLLGRRHKKALDEAAMHLPAAFDTRAFAAAVRTSEHRLAHLLTGAVVSAVDYMRRHDRDLDRAQNDPSLLLEHSLINDLLRYVLSAESHAERQRLGTAWVAPL
jgi:tetratricopeptide (TPR) repeat protein